MGKRSTHLGHGWRCARSRHNHTGRTPKALTDALCREIGSAAENVGRTVEPWGWAVRAGRLGGAGNIVATFKDNLK